MHRLRSRTFKIFFTTIFLGFTEFANSASLAGISTGYLSYADPAYVANETFFFQVNTSTSTGCNTTARFAINSTSKNFKTLIATVMAAHASGTPMTVNYSANCTTYPNSYDANYVCVGSLPC
ncbi:MAG: hypothetical protein V4525_07995 [Pseudomonadota bacterium]